MERDLLMFNYNWYGEQINPSDYLTIGSICSNSVGYITSTPTQKLKILISVDKIIRSGNLYIMLDDIRIMDIPISSNKTVLNFNLSINGSSKLQLRADNSLNTLGNYIASIGLS